MYMANMALNSSMNTEETIKKLIDKDENTGEYKIPKIIYSDAYYSETVPYADLVLPDTIIPDNNMASYLLFAGSDGVMNEMVESQWQM